MNIAVTEVAGRSRRGYHVQGRDSIDAAISVPLGEIPTAILLRCNWVEINKPPPFRVTESEDWKLVAQEELRKYFKLGTQTHLWRATLVKLKNHPQSHVLLFMYDHAIADGMSKVILVNTLLNYYILLVKGEHLVGK